MISSETTFFDYRPGSQLRVTGEDAFGFLQGQFTNELRQAPGSATYGLWLNQKGKVLADSHVLRVAEKEFLLTSAQSPVTVIRPRLEEYIVADDVTLSDETPSTRGLLLAGARSKEVISQVMAEVPAPGRFVHTGAVVLFAGRRRPGENYELLGPKEAVAEIREKLAAQGARAANADENDFARIVAGIPAVPMDLGPGDLPNEGGLEDSALSYTKGCYLGQEVMARLKNLGQVRRRLQVVRGHGPVPAPLTALYQGEKKVGEVRSAAASRGEFAALAMLSLINLRPEEGLSLAPGGPTVVTLDHHG